MAGLSDAQCVAASICAANVDLPSRHDEITVNKRPRAESRVELKGKRDGWTTGTLKFPSRCSAVGGRVIEPPGAVAVEGELPSADQHNSCLGHTLPLPRRPSFINPVICAVDNLVAGSARSQRQHRMFECGVRGAAASVAPSIRGPAPFGDVWRWR